MAGGVQHKSVSRATTTHIKSKQSAGEITRASAPKGYVSASPAEEKSTENLLSHMEEHFAEDNLEGQDRGVEEMSRGRIKIEMAETPTTTAATSLEDMEAASAPQERGTVECLDFVAEEVITSDIEAPESQEIRSSRRAALTATSMEELRAPKEEEGVLSHNEAQFSSVGSVSTTSDDDYTFSRSGATEPGGMQPRPGATNKYGATVDKFKALIEEADTGEVELPTEEENDMALLKQKDRKLSKQEKVNALRALKAAGGNWFKAVAMYETDSPKLLWDIRLLEMELTEELAKGIDADFDNVSESDFIKCMNEGVREAFGKEAGILFDTNYYTAHKALDEVTFCDAEIKAQHQESSNIMALVKVAEHTETQAEFILEAAGDLGISIEALGDDISFENLKSLAADASKAEMYETAWAKMEETATAVSNTIEEVVIGTLTELHELQSADTPSAKAKTELLLTKLGFPKGSEISPELEKAMAAIIDSDSPTMTNELKALLTDAGIDIEHNEELELEAKNILYADKLQDTQEKMILFQSQESDINAMLNNDDELKELFESGDFAGIIDKFETDDTLEELLDELGLDDIDPPLTAEQREDVIDALSAKRSEFEQSLHELLDSQSSSLLFANEPYYSDDTIKGVVKAIQMRTPTKASASISMRENYGDIKKDKHHYAGSPGKFAFRGSKYMWRMSLSANNFLGTVKQEKLSPEQQKEFNALNTKAKKFTAFTSNLLSIRKSNMSPQEKIQASLREFHVSEKSTDEEVAAFEERLKDPAQLEQMSRELDDYCMTTAREIKQGVTAFEFETA